MEPPAKKVHLEEKQECQASNHQQIEDTETCLTYDDLRNIFKYLNGKDLYQVAKVCSSWREAAKSEKNTRQKVEYYLRHCKVNSDTALQGSYQPSFIGKEVRIKPVLALICKKVEKEDEWLPEGCYCENLPTNCSTVILGGYDIILDNLKVDEDNLGMSACSFLPEIPQLRKQLFYIDNYTFKGTTNEDINEYVKQTIKQLLPAKNERPKCIIMLTSREGFNFTKLLIKGLQKRYRVGSLSLWGGVCVDLKICNGSESIKKCSQAVRWVAVTLSSPSLKTWSIVLLRSCRKEIDMEKKLEIFKRKITLRRHSLGLMFACCDRLLRKNLEIKVFKKVFPAVPLIGLHGDGEYGLNSFSYKKEFNLQHAFSTTFLILTYQ